MSIVKGQIAATLWIAFRRPAGIISHSFSKEVIKDSVNASCGKYSPYEASDLISI